MLNASRMPAVLLTLLAVLVCLCGNPTLAQVAPPHADTLRSTNSPVSLSSGFERNVNTFLWDFSGLATMHSDEWRLSMNDRFQRTLIRAGGETIKDQNSLTIDAAHALRTNLSLVSSLSSFIFSDDRGLGLNDLATTRALAGARWNLFDLVSLSPLAGFSIDNQQGIQDEGLMYSTQALLNNLRLGRTDANAELYLSAEYITPRYQHEYRGNTDFTAHINETSVNQTQLAFRETRREFYLMDDDAEATPTTIHNRIESRNEQTIGLRDMLRYSMLDVLAFIANVDVSQRAITRERNDKQENSGNPFFSTRISEFTLNGNAQFDYDNSDGTRGGLRIELNERDESHELRPFEGAAPSDVARQQRLEEQKNNTIQQTQLGLLFSHAVGLRDTLAGSAATVKLRYDTPSGENNDDRDELVILAGLRWVHRFSPEFMASLSGDLAMRHTVYIFAERSANNTWNRVLRISPSSELRISQGFVSKNSADIVANYTVYDFEQEAQGQQSFSLRQLTLVDSTSIRLGDLFWMDATVHLRWYERGELRWSAFTVRPVQFFQEQTSTFSLRRQSDHWEFSAGIRYFEQNRFVYKGASRTFSGRLRNYGPTARLQYTLSMHARVFIDGWYQLTSEENRETRTTPNIVIQTVWNL